VTDDFYTHALKYSVNNMKMKRKPFNINYFFELVLIEVDISDNHVRNRKSKEILLHKNIICLSGFD
jgi:hypothetical protein